MLIYLTVSKLSFNKYYIYFSQSVNARMGQFAYISERIPLLQQPNFLSILFFHFFLRLSITLFSSNHTAVCTEILIPTIHTFFNGFLSILATSARIVIRN